MQGVWWVLDQVRVSWVRVSWAWWAPNTALPYLLGQGLHVPAKMLGPGSRQGIKPSPQAHLALLIKPSA